MNEKGFEACRRRLLIYEVKMDRKELWYQKRRDFAIANVAKQYAKLQVEVVEWCLG